MQTILYQGHPIEAELVNHISGNISTTSGEVEGNEKLFRDEQGRYYLQRKLDRSVFNAQTGGREWPATSRARVHRLSVHAAILWAVTRANSTTLALRTDAADLLRTGSGDGGRTALFPPLPSERRPPKAVPGHYGKVWLSPEFLAWSKQHHLKPTELAAAVLHTFALKTAGGNLVIQAEGRAVEVEDIYDLPVDSEQGW